MIIKKILLLGGTGFIGASLAEELTQRGYFVTVPTRRRARAKHLLVLPTIDIVEADVHDEAMLFRLAKQHDAVINLIGILHGDFEREHVAFPKMVAETCVKAGVQRLIHMSALCADANTSGDVNINGPSEYLKSRGRGEAAVLAVAKNNPSLHVTVFQPSVVFGENDKFLNMFTSLVKAFPVIPLGSPNARFQPVWVSDVARAIAMSVGMTTTFGATYPLVGPKVYSLKELIELMIAISGKPRAVIGLPAGLSMLQAMLFQYLPGKLITPDNVRSMRIPNTSATPFPAIFGEASELESTVRCYMKNSIGRGQYQRFRAKK